MALWSLLRFLYRQVVASLSSIIGGVQFICGLLALSRFDDLRGYGGHPGEVLGRSGKCAA